jgi:ATP-dependent DNA helicase PIF1
VSRRQAARPRLNQDRQISRHPDSLCAPFESPTQHRGVSRTRGILYEFSVSSGTSSGTHQQTNRKKHSMAPPTTNSSQEQTPNVEPRDSPLPTPVSQSPAPAQSKHARDEANDDDTEDVSAGGPGVNLGQSMLTHQNKRPRVPHLPKPHRTGSQHPEPRHPAPHQPGPHDHAIRTLLLARMATTDNNARRSIPEFTPIKTEPQDAHAEPFDPLGDIPAYTKGPKLRYNQLDDDQRLVVDSAVKYGKNICCVGGAGTGKSGTCEVIMNELRDLGRKVVIVAPSGTSAVNVRAQTLHSFFGVGAQSNKGIDTYKRKMKPAVRERLRNVDTLVIDEISMVSYEMFDRMDQLSRTACGDVRPFGGMQILVFGDFCQLPPVKPQAYCYTCGIERKKITLPGYGRGKRGPMVWHCDDHGDISDSDKMWAFQSQEWKNMNFAFLPLNQPHRQADVEFLKLLNKLRHGQPFTSKEIETLEDHPCDVTNAVKIVPLRVDALAENNSRFDELPGEECRFCCQDKFVWEREAHPELADINRDVQLALSGHNYERWVCLKVDQPVILQKNLNVEKGLINGSQGVITGFVEYDEARHPRGSTVEGGRVAHLRRQCIENFMRSQKVPRLPIVKFNNQEAPETIYPDCGISERGFTTPHSLLIRTQIPLLSGWALTIHKTQGMTLDRAIVDVGRCFVAGMAYVAPSRVKNLEGLQVDGLGTNGVKYAVDDEVKTFLQENF